MILSSKTKFHVDNNFYDCRSFFLPHLNDLAILESWEAYYRIIWQNDQQHLVDMILRPKFHFRFY